MYPNLPAGRQVLGSYFFFRQGEKRRQSLCSDEYFQHEQTLFVNRTADGMLKEKERVKWVDYIFPSP